MIILLIIGYFILFLLVIFLSFLFIPVYFLIHANNHSGIYLSISVNWLFHALSFHLEQREGKKTTFIFKIIGIKIPLDLKKTSEKKTEKTKKRKKYNYKYLLNKLLFKKILQVITKIIKHIAPKKFKINLLYGFENPADTGILCGYFATFSEYFSQFDFKFVPVFDREIFEGEIFLEGRIFIFILIYYFLEIILSKTFRETMKKVKKN